jgi:hypothetical protein
MDESFIEHHHQISGRASKRTCNVPGIERQSMSALKFEALSANKSMKANIIEVNNNAKQKFKDADPETGGRNKVQAKI